MLVPQPNTTPRIESFRLEWERLKELPSHRHGLVQLVGGRVDP